MYIACHLPGLPSGPGSRGRHMVTWMMAVIHLEESEHPCTPNSKISPSETPQPQKTFFIPKLWISPRFLSDSSIPLPGTGNVILVFETGRHVSSWIIKVKMGGARQHAAPHGPRHPIQCESVVEQGFGIPNVLNPSLRRDDLRNIETLIQ